MTEQIPDGLQGSLGPQQLNRVCVAERMCSSPAIGVDAGLLQPPANHRPKA